MKKEVTVTTQHEKIVGGKYGGKKGTMLARGWHDNYTEFETKDGTKGCVCFYGDKVLVEVGKSHRFEINLQALIQELVAEAEADQ